MIAKKNPGADLERRRHVFFQIGLLVAGSFTLAAFSYSDASVTTHEKQAVKSSTIIYDKVLVDPPKIKKVEPKVTKVKTPPVMPNPNLQQNKSLQNVTKSSNTKQLPMPDVGLPAIDITFDEGIGDDGDDEIIEFPPIDAKWKNGGSSGMQQYINDELEYPELDRMYGTEGTVYVSFVVEKDGSISNVKIERGVSDTIDREAKRLVKSFPKWDPAETEYGKVRSRVRLPLRFILVG